MLTPMPYAAVPEHLSRILCLNSHDAKNSYRKLQSLINANQFLQILVERGLNQHNYTDLQQLFHTLGLRNFRNQLTALYLEFFESGKFSFRPDLTYIQDLLTFEDRFEKFSAPGGNRVFLLALYLKLADAQMQAQGLLEDFEFINPPAELEEILRLGKSGQEEVDILILLMWQILGFWGERELRAKLSVARGDFKIILKQMDEVKRTRIIESMLVYSASINQNDIFMYHPKV